MIGYYIHHHGRGHVSRAIAIAQYLVGPVTGLSSAPRPAEWVGDWVSLPSDTNAAPRDPDAQGRLHWAPLDDAGLRARMSRIARWIDVRRPHAMVVDVSVEVALLARLHGVPIITVAMPGQRHDAAHTLGFDISTEILAAWPPRASGMLQGLPSHLHARVRPVGAISRFAPYLCGERATRGRRSVVVLGGAGGDDFSAYAIDVARRETPHWDWTHLGVNGIWSETPWEHLLGADVVVTHAGESAIADVAAARCAAIVIPQHRPHYEQQTTGAVLADSTWPALILPRFAKSGWGELLESASQLNGSLWSKWNDGRGAERAASVIMEVAASRGVPA